jgi:hypothetical protein
MTKAILPRTNQTGANEWSDVESNDNALAEVINGQLDNENIKEGAGITRGKLDASAKGIQGASYGAKVIATEESRTNTAFGTLATPDEITGIVVPENGLLVVGFMGAIKSSVNSAGSAAIFIGANQLKYVPEKVTKPEVQEVPTASTSFRNIGTSPSGLVGNTTIGLGWEGDVTTGQVIGGGTGGGGMTWVGKLAAGTYAISVKYKATSGSVTAKERALWAFVVAS